MDVKSAAQTIRDTVEMQQILDLYGYRTKHGFMVCPFHGDTDASLKVYPGNRGWCCYGCNREGSVIDFVMEHENCDFRTAVRAIDNALKLGLFSEREDPYEAEMQKRIQQWFDDFVGAIYAYLDALETNLCVQQRILLKNYKTARDKDIRERTADENTLLLTFEEDSKFNEYRLDRIQEFREEVAAWRRKARKVRSVSSRKK